ncbi:hypothetical protein RB195_010932 [Necator americanus]|uniref:Uncharacterized protein n=1 Tax=Necator americanus TaxID=51031 RepID=A0ABR1D1W5_NECAM
MRSGGLDTFCGVSSKLIASSSASCTPDVADAVRLERHPGRRGLVGTFGLLSFATTVTSESRPCQHTSNEERASPTPTSQFVLFRTSLRKRKCWQI